MPSARDLASADVIAALAARAADRHRDDEAGLVAAFLTAYWARVSAEDVLAREPADLYGAALAHLHLGRRRSAGSAVVRVYSPTVADDGWQSTRSVLDIVTEDAPFLVDSVAMTVAELGVGVHLIVHPVLDVRREGEAIVGLGDGRPESWIHIELDRLADADTVQLELAVQQTLVAVRAVVADWAPMRDRCRALADEAAKRTAGAEPAALLQWMADDHFTFLGYREYELVDAPGGSEVTSVEGTGLGLLRAAPPSSRPLSALSEQAAADARDPDLLLIITKTNGDAPVHRPGPMDYVSFKWSDPSTGRLREHRFLGQWTTRLYRTSVLEIPVVRATVRAVLDRAALPPGSHDGNRLLDILEGYPREELLQIDAADLHDTAMAILHLRERPQVRLFVRPDRWKRFVSCLVYVPRDRFDTRVRLRIQAVLMDVLGGVELAFTTELGMTSHARLHLRLRVRPDAVVPADVAVLEARLARLTQTWEDDLRRSLVEALGDDEGQRRFVEWQSAFPPSYHDEVEPMVAVEDIRRIEQLGPDDIAVALQQPPEAGPRELRLRVHRTGSPIQLSTALPFLRDLGVTVLDERPWELDRGPDESPAWVYDFGLLLPADLSAHGARRAFEVAFLAVWRGDADSDTLGQLVLTAGLDWREVALLRTYRQFLRQGGVPFSQGYVDETLTGNAGIATRLVQLFHARLHPERHDEAAAETIRAELLVALDAVASLDEDRILRGFAVAIDATDRTNWYQERPTIALKLDSQRVLELPAPRPAHEVFVHAPHVEGVHLRMGRIARGGLRWSDRREDFRTEVLGLVKAQTVKNAVIVPVGAKGGFVCRQLPVDADRATVQAEVVRCYRTFVEALLDVTDTLVGGSVVSPPSVVRHDSDDPYLVVAADKGTATFSDLANEISLGRGFWLGDAFASGGSTGYDHKAMGITARGTWESVRRHFRHLGVDADNDEITVVGIGDMSGDVFGNGMLLSRHLRLVAAFDHRHIFLDPAPDPARSFAERDRLFQHPGSSWADYDPDLLSAGGGVFPRTAKSITVTPEAAGVLGIEPGPVPPNQLISAILRAPVDLFWNGGIGTYVRASTETNENAHDRANDAVRVAASELRCRVVGEGGNLGFTQRARVEAARRGVLLNTDAIDNSAGVDCSDHEVNLKILLNEVVAAGDLTVKQRNELLEAMTAEVAADVLEDNYGQNLVLTAARAQAPGMVDVHLRHLAWLERVAGLDRQLEALPSDEELIERTTTGEGLTQPELAVLLAHTKIRLAAELLASDLPDDPAFVDELADYFPTPIRARFATALPNHPLRREIIATQVTNQLVNLSGISMVHRMQEETSASAADIVRAHAVAWKVFGLGPMWREVEALDFLVDAHTQLGCLLEVKKLAERATRWFVRNRRTPLVVATTVAEFAPVVSSVTAALPGAMRVLTYRADLEEASAVERAGVPRDLARRVALLPMVIIGLDIVDLTRGDRSTEQVLDAYFLLDERLGLGWLRSRITQLPRDDRWQALARAALRDDFFAEHKRLTDQILGGHRDEPAEVLVDKWFAEHHELVSRAMRVVSDVRATPVPGLAQLSVALREFRNLAHQAAGVDD